MKQYISLLCFLFKVFCWCFLLHNVLSYLTCIDCWAGPVRTEGVTPVRLRGVPFPVGHQVWRCYGGVPGLSATVQGGSRERRLRVLSALSDGQRENWRRLYWQLFFCQVRERLTITCEQLGVVKLALPHVIRVNL